MNKERFKALDRVNFEHNGVIKKINKKLHDSEEQIAILQESLSETATRNAATIHGLEAQISAMSKENDDAMSAATDLTARCENLHEDLECTRAKNAELEAAKEKSEESAQKLEVDVEALGSEKAHLEERLSKLIESEKELTQLHKDAEANVKRLSDEVVFTHEEISRLSAEKDAISEEAGAQLQKADDRLNEIEDENKLKREEYKELWTRSNASLLEKESAMETVKQLKHEQQQIENSSCIIPPLQEKVKELQQQIENMTETEQILREMNKLLESEKEVAVELAKKELEVDNENLRQEMDMLSRQTDIIGQSYITGKDQMQNEFEDMTWKINALTQNMNVRLKEKDSIISRLETQMQCHHNEATMLKHEIQKRDAEKTSPESQANALPNLVSMIEEQSTELEQNDVLISNMRTEETHYKSEILRMQTKLDNLEAWLHESISFASPPPSPAKSYSNPQSPTKSTPKRYSSSK